MLEKKAEWAGVFVASLGAIILLAAIFNWDWIFQGKRNKLSLPWISERYGRNTARCIAGILGLLIVAYGVYFIIMV